MIDTLQNAASVKPHLSFTSIKKSFYENCQIFSHALSFQTITPRPSTKSISRTTHTKTEDCSHEFAKPSKALFDPLIFTDRKNLPIDQ